MNLRTTLFFLALLAALASFGQPGGEMRTSSFNGEQSIVRQDPSTGRYVSFSLQAGTDAHFALSDNIQMYDVKVSDNIRVTDFEILNKMVFFCGDDFVNHSGIFGYFNIDSLFFYNGRVHIDATLSALGMLTLDNIEVYCDPSCNEIHVAGYGHSPTSSNADMLFEAVGHPTTGMNYRTMQVPSTGWYPNIVDMTITQNYAVFLSQNMLDGSYLSSIGVELYPFPKFAMFDTHPFTTDFFQFGGTIYAGTMAMRHTNPYYQPRIVHYDNDKVAVLSHGIVTYISTVLPSIGELSFHTFDLSPLSAGNHILMTSAHSVSLPNPNVYNIVDVQYDYGLLQYLVLHQYQTSTGNIEYGITHIDCSGGSFPSSVVSECPQPFNSYNVWFPGGFCLDPGSRYTVVGWFRSTPYSYLFWQGDIVPGLFGCVVKYIYPTTPDLVCESKQDIYDKKPAAWKKLVFLNPRNRPVLQDIIDIICD